MAQDAIEQATATPASIRYEDDLHGWAVQQVALLRAGRLAAIDAANIAEELSDVGQEQFYRLESAVAVLTHHLLKWDHQPERRSRSWHLTIAEQRRRIVKVLRKNPSLKASLAEAIADGYADGRGRAADETGLPLRTFPAECPYTMTELLDRDLALEFPLD